MSWSAIFRTVGAYLWLLSALLLFMGLSAFYAEGGAVGKQAGIAFFITGVGTLLVGCIRIPYASQYAKILGVREAILSVLLIWLLTAFITAFPMYLGGMFSSYLDSLFEAVSSITTTGSTAIPGSEMTGVKLADCSKTLAFWRPLLQGISGLGIVVFFILFLPSVGARGRMLFRYESTGPTFSPIYPTVRQTAVALTATYCGLIVLCMASIYMVCPAVPLLENSALALSSLATGGIPMTDAGVAGYQSPHLEWVVTLFMFIGAISLPLIFDIVRGRFWRIFDAELHIYVLLTLGVIAFSYFQVQNLRVCAFNVVSAISTTGFSLGDYAMWPIATQILLLIGMYWGGMAGSTAGGIKIIRLMILWECLKHSIISLFQPERVRVFRVAGHELPMTTAFGALSFFLVVVVSATLGIVILLAEGLDLMTAVGLSGCMLNNTGVSFGMAAPAYNCAALSPLAKSISIIWMLLGRLEYYIWITVFLPSFWRK